MPEFSLTREAVMNKRPVVGIGYYNLGYFPDRVPDYSKVEIEADSTQISKGVQILPDEQRANGANDNIRSSPVMVTTGEITNDEKFPDELTVNGTQNNSSSIPVKVTAGGGVNDEISAVIRIAETKSNGKLPDVKENNEDNEDDEDNVPDGGWGYVVVLGCVVNMVIIAFSTTSFGILYSDFLLKLGTSSTVISWIFTTYTLLLQVTRLLMSPLVDMLGWRVLTFMAGILYSMGICLSGFATSASEIIVTFCLFAGPAVGICWYVCILIVPFYFKKKQGRANGLVVSALALGGIIAPLLITFLQEEYGYRGAALILGAIALHICVSALVFHPVVRHAKRSTKNVAKNENSDSFTTAAIAKKLQEALSTMKRDFRQIRSPQFMIVLLCSTISLSFFILVSAMIPFVMESRDFTQTESSWCLSTAYACSMVARLVASFLSDFRWFNMRAAYLAGGISTTLGIFACSFVLPLEWMMVAMAGWGAGAGMCNGLFPLITVQFLGLDKFKPLLSLQGVTSAICFFTTGPLLGLISEVTGSYTTSLWIMTAITSLISLLWLLLPAAAAYDERQEKLRQSREQG